MPKPSKPATESKASKAPKSEDIALVCGRTDDGKGLHVLRKRGPNLEAGVVQPLEEGKPIHGELVTLRQRGETPLCDIEVHYATPAAKAAAESAAKSSPRLSPGSSANPGAANAASSSDDETRGHPAQVASDSYRKNWDTIWNRKAPKKNLLN
jgi:hypothetical protein